MKISGFEPDSTIMKELGSRLKAERIRQQMTQEQLAVNSGVGKSTIERFERGESIQFLNLIKVLRTLHQLQALETLLPSAELSPMQYLYSKTEVNPQRFRFSEESNSPYGVDKGNIPAGTFVWEEDK